MQGGTRALLLLVRIALIKKLTHPVRILGGVVGRQPHHTLKLFNPGCFLSMLLRYQALDIPAFYRKFPENEVSYALLQ
jgi:hypothetical protein